MTLKERKKTKWVAHFVFINTFIFTILICFFPCFSAAQDKPKVNIFEFTFESPDESDITLKKLIEKRLVDDLNESKKIEKLEFISYDLLSMLGRKEEYLRKTGIRYVIYGHVEGFSDDTMKIKIELIDRSIDGNTKARILWDKSKTMKKDLKKWDSWFSRVSHYICSIIEGKPIIEVIFTHCFETHCGKDRTVSYLKMLLPMELKNMLKKKGLGEQYKIITFDDEREVTFECVKKSSDGRDLQNYEYVIFGHIKPYQRSEMLEVVVVVQITNEDREEFIKGFKERKDSPDFIENLAVYIIKKWPEISAK